MLEAPSGREIDPARIVDVDLTSDALLQEVHNGLAQQWATRAPFYVRQGAVLQVIVCRYKDVLEVFQDGERFSASPPSFEGMEYLDQFNGSPNVARMDGLPHDRVRRVMNPPFGPAALAPVEEAVRAIFDEKIDRILARGGDFDAVADLCGDIVRRVLLGAILNLSAEQQDSMARLHDRMALVLSTKPGEPHPPELLKAYEDARQVIFDMIAARRASPSQDFIGRLVAARDNGDGVEDDETIFGNTLAVIAAGLGSTASSLAAALMNLCRHPSQFELLKSRPELAKSAVEECLRYHGPGFLGFPRFALGDTEVGGTFVPRGAMMLMVIQAACFDPDAFPDPLRFDITRSGRSIPVFGAGAHHCLGNRLARFIMTIGLQQVIRRLPTLRLVDPDFRPRYTGVFGETSPTSIPLTIN